SRHGRAPLAEPGRAVGRWSMSRQEIVPVGLTKAPGPTPHSFTFVAPDPDRQLKFGEFVTYETEAEGKCRTVLARVVDRQALRLYPISFLADPTVGPDAVAVLVGYRGTRAESFELTAQVIGYFDQTLRDFINPRISPPTG